MPKGTNQKLKLYRLAQIMLENTDDEHYITMPEIMEELVKPGDIVLVSNRYETQMCAIDCGAQAIICLLYTSDAADE